MVQLLLKSGRCFIIISLKNVNQGRKISNEANELQEQERDIFCASETSFDAYKLYSTCLNDKTCATIFPN